METILRNLLYFEAFQTLTQCKCLINSIKHNNVFYSQWNLLVLAVTLNKNHEGNTYGMICTVKTNLSQNTCKLACKYPPTNKHLFYLDGQLNLSLYLCENHTVS